MSDNETPLSESLELVPITSAHQLAEILSGMLEAPEPSAEELQQARYGIIAEMLTAETEDELWRELPTWSSKDSIDETFEIHSAHAWRSRYENEQGQRGGFLSCRAVHLDSGEEGILNTGAMRLCGRIGWYHLHNRFPIKLRVVEIGQSSRGYPILDARLLADPVDARVG